MPWQFPSSVVVVVVVVVVMTLSPLCVQVVVLVLDGQEMLLRRMEQTLASMVYSEGRCLVIAANKADLLECSTGHYAKGVRDQLEVLLPQVRRRAW